MSTPLISSLSPLSRTQYVKYLPPLFKVRVSRGEVPTKREVFLNLVMNNRTYTQLLGTEITRVERSNPNTGGTTGK